MPENSVNDKIIDALAKLTSEIPNAAVITASVIINAPANEHKIDSVFFVTSNGSLKPSVENTAIYVRLLLDAIDNKNTLKRIVNDLLVLRDVTDAEITRIVGMYEQKENTTTQKTDDKQQA